MFHERTEQAAKGNWRGILISLGVPDNFLVSRHGPCPLCGGKDRFRWDNRDGRGTYICGQCGAGDGFILAMKFTGKTFAEVAAKIDGILRNVKPDVAVRSRPTEEEIRSRNISVYKASASVQPGDLVHRYLASRNLEEPVYPKALRFVAKLPDGEGGLRPSMIAMVGRYGQPKFDTIHRTFLKPDGSGKAEMARPRKLMPGPVPDGACIMLSDWTESGPLGIAEGIETAMAASATFGIPVWAAVNSAMLCKWTPPPGCDEVVVFGDNDRNYTGQAAAYGLAQRLSVMGHVASVKMPPDPGTDWADVHQAYPKGWHRAA
jgi:putative DNA primase/helicase